MRRAALDRVPAVEPDAAEPTHVAHPLLGEPVGGHRRRDLLAARGANTARVVSKIPLARCWARSKENPSSSSATWIRPPEFTQ